MEHSQESELNVKVLPKRNQLAWLRLGIHGQMLGLMLVIQIEMFLLNLTHKVLDATPTQELELSVKDLPKRNLKAWLKEETHGKMLGLMTVILAETFLLKLIQVVLELRMENNMDHIQELVLSAKDLLKRNLIAWLKLETHGLMLG